MSTDVSEVRATSIIMAMIASDRQYIPDDSELHTRRRENLKLQTTTQVLRKSLFYGPLQFSQS
jgi:hypothetical protein